MYNLCIPYKTVCKINELNIDFVLIRIFNLLKFNLPSSRSEERRVGKSVDLGGRRIIKKIFFFQAEDGIRDCGW